MRSHDTTHSIGVHAIARLADRGIVVVTLTIGPTVGDRGAAIPEQVRDDALSMVTAG